jgi:hypothetical protein
VSSVHRGLGRRLFVPVLIFALLGSFLALIVAGSPQTEAAATTSNPIVAENKKPGAPGWQIPWSGRRLGDDVKKQVKGYTTASSVNKGQPLTFRITTTPAQKYQIHIYRLGYYSGAGARLVTTSGWRAGITQPSCPVSAATGLIECKWSNSWTLATSTSWTSGMYMAVLTNAQNYQNYVPFVVRDDMRKAAGIVVEPFSTYAAYNRYPYDNKTGKNMYDGWGPIVKASGFQRAVKSSLDRPFHGNGSGRTFQGPSSMSRWLEQQGYDVAYAVSQDLHTGVVNLDKYRLYVSTGHDEYWSAEMYNRVQAARDKGSTHFAFMTANNIYWQIRMEKSSAGWANRIVVCYRTRTYDPIKTGKVTMRWRDLSRPEQKMLGAMYISMVPGEPNGKVKTPSSFVFNGTGLTAGSTIPRLIMGEADMIHSGVGLPRSKSFTVLTDAPYKDLKTTVARKHQAVIYQAPSGSWVFNSGTFNWPHLIGTPGKTDAKVQRMTANIFSRMLATPVRSSGQGVQFESTAAVVAPGYSEPNQGRAPAASSGLALPTALGRSVQGVQAVGDERYQDKLGHVFTPTQVGKGQAMVVLATRDGRVEDFGSKTNRFSGDSVQVRDFDSDGVLEILTQDSGAVPDAATGGAIETVHRWDGSDYRVGECRRLVGESFQYLTYPPSAQGDCLDYPEATE